VSYHEPFYFAHYEDGDQDELSEEELVAAITALAPKKCFQLDKSENSQSSAEAILFIQPGPSAQ
jgi:hypothetical protein